MVNGETFAKKKSAGSQEAIILLGHGSRVPEAGKDMERVAARLREKYGYPIIEVCFMSRLGPHFPEVFEKCVKLGATRSFSDVRQLVLPSKEMYPVPEGQCEFVPLPPDEAAKYRT